MELWVMKYYLSAIHHSAVLSRVNFALFAYVNINSSDQSPKYWLSNIPQSPVNLLLKLKCSVSKDI
jgi:hypothetical protein